MEQQQPQVQNMNDAIRMRARTLREWLEIGRNLSDLTPYEQQVLDYALRRRDDFPRPDYDVKRVIDVEPGFTQQADFDVKQLLQTQNSASLSYFAKLLPPTGYNPCPTEQQIADSFSRNNYFLNRDDVFSIHQAILTGRPITVSGPPGTGKSELAKQIAIALGLNINDPTHFGELFCTPDITKGESIYSWNDARRLIDMQLVSNLSSRLQPEALKKAYVEVSNNAYSHRYLDLQVLLRACVIPYRTVVLIDEIDKTYHEFDNNILDIVDKNRFVVPEFGPVGRKEYDPSTSPIFVLTSNMTRALSGPLVRRCKAIFYDYLPENLETKVIVAKTGISNNEAGLIASFFKEIRTHQSIHLQQPPSTAEVIETAKALLLSKIQITKQNILKMHAHWIKYRVDYIAVEQVFKDSQGNWQV